MSECEGIEKRVSRGVGMRDCHSGSGSRTDSGREGRVGRKGREGGCVYTCKMSSIGWRRQCNNSKKNKLKESKDKAWREGRREGRGYREPFLFLSTFSVSTY